jgi:hypothetical protein
MHKKNTLYYVAAAATLLLFIIALIGLASCGDEDNAGATTQDPAVLNAYQQGYLDGYSKGYSAGFFAGMDANNEEETTSSRGCALPSEAAAADAEPDE